MDRRYFYYTVDFDSLVHHGVKGQKWGERRYQNKDGTWTSEGKARRRKEREPSEKQLKKNSRIYMNLYNSIYDVTDKAYKRNKTPNPWANSKVRRAANAFLKNSRNDPYDGLYPEVYKNKKSADKKK